MYNTGITRYQNQDKDDRPRRIRDAQDDQEARTAEKPSRARHDAPRRTTH